MTNTELISKIKAEIERRQKHNNRMAYNAINSNMRNFYDGEEDCCRQLLSFIDSLQQEQPIKVYRVENEKEQKGLWRKFDGTWEPLFDMLTDGQCKDMPMEDSPIYREGGKQWFASAPSKETLQKWFSKRDLEELTAKGFTISEFEVVGHKKISDFEYIFTRDSIISRTYLKVSDIYPQEQPGVDLENELDRYLRGEFQQTAGGNFNNYIQVARHFAEWGYLRAAEKYNEIEYNQQRAEESIPKDLEEAADSHIREVVDAAGHPGWEWETRDIKDAFIAGAKWQADHAPLPEDTVLFNKGVEEGRRLAEEEQADLFTIVALDAAQRAKEQMMKEAVDAEILLTPYPTIWLDDCKDYDFKDGQKVRVIFIKEDEK